jgi:hypothetical protein
MDARRGGFNAYGKFLCLMGDMSFFYGTAAFKK